MIQIFFTAPSLDAVHKALADAHIIIEWHGIPSGDWIIGVVFVKTDTEPVVNALEAAGISLLPDHKGKELIAPVHVTALAPHGVVVADTTQTAMQKVFDSTGFHALKPRRY